MGGKSKAFLSVGRKRILDRLCQTMGGLFEEILLVIFDVKAAAYLIAGESFFEQGRGGEESSEMVGEGTDCGVGGGVVGVEHSSEAFDSSSGVA